MASTLVINILANASDAKKVIGEVSKSVEGLGDEGSKMGKVVAAGAATALTALVALGASALDAAQESARVGRETERVLRTTGAAAFESVQGVQALSQALSDKAGVDDEVIQSGANLLLTFTQVRNEVGAGNDIFDRATAAALDMSVALGTDMSSAALQLGKALNDPIKGLGALSRAGVSFTSAQRDQVQALVAAGDALGAQKIILAEVEKEFKGAAEAAATPFDKLKVAIGNLEEDLGGKLIPPFTAFVNFLLTNLNPGLEATGNFLAQNSEALKLVASAAAAAVIVGYAPLVAAQLAVIGTGILDFIFRLNVAFDSLAGATSLSAVATELFGGALAGTAAAIATTAGPIIALTGAIYAIAAVMDQSSEDADKFFKAVTQDVDLSNLRSMKDASRQVGDEITRLRKSISETGWGDVAAAVADVLIPFHDVENSLDDQESKLATLDAKQKEYNQKITEAEGKLFSYAEAHVLAAHGIDANASASLAMTDANAKLNAEIDQTNAALKDIAQSKKIELTEPGAVDRVTALWERTKVLGSSTLDLTDAQKKFNDAASDAKDKVDAYKSSLDALIGVHLSAAEAETNLSQNSFKLAKTLAENQKVVTSTTQEGTLARLQQTAAIDENNKAVQDNVKQILDMANATFRESQQTEGSTVALGKANDVLTTQRDKLIATMVQFGYSEDAAKAYVDRLGLTPGNINTQVNLDNRQAMAGINSVLDGYGKIKQGVLGEVSLVVKALGGSITAVLNGGGREAGGPVWPGGAFLVGERGPELFVPRASGQIVPNGMFGGTTVINVNVAHTGLGVDSPKIQRDIVGAIRRYAQREGPVKVV